MATLSFRERQRKRREEGRRAYTAKSSDVTRESNPANWSDRDRANPENFKKKQAQVRAKRGSLHYVPKHGDYDPNQKSYKPKFQVVARKGKRKVA